MILILMAAGILMNLVAGTAGLNLWALVAPLLFVAFPCMALTAAFAVLFEPDPVAETANRISRS